MARTLGITQTGEDWAAAANHHGQRHGTETVGMVEDELIARIYEAAAMPELWPDTLDVLARFVGGRGGMILRQSPSGAQHLYSPEIDEIARAWHDGGWHEDNQRIGPMLGMDYPGFLTDLDLHTPEERRTLPCYIEFLTPRGADLGAGTLINRAHDEKVAITVELFSDEEVLLAAVPRLDALRPHLARAAVLTAELQMREARATVEALGRTGSPAAMLGSHGQVIAANSGFAALLDDWAVDARDRLRLRDRATDRALADALGPLLAQGCGASLAIRDELGQGVAALHLIPARRSARDVFTGATAIALVARPSQQGSPDTGLLQSLFDLTPAEASVARAVAGGDSVETIAASSAKSVETVRSHLKRVFSKTGTGRQNELAILLHGFARPG